MRPGLKQRLCVLAILGALALQMELPAAHAAVHKTFASACQAASGPPDLRAASHTLASAGDPATCSVCQSLHAKPALTPPAQAARSLPELGAVVPAATPRAHAHVARSGHPPRAPPLEALAFA